MRWVLAAMLLAACGGRASSPEPAWPKSAGWQTPDSWEEDGGESLEPRADHLSAVEESEPEVLPEEPVDSSPADVMLEAQPEVPSSSDAAPADATPEGAIIIEGEPPPDSSDAP
jgi:hypothetical protein